MKEEFQKFIELVKTDEDLRMKLEEAVKNYDGEQNGEAVFNAVLLPIAKEAGFCFTMDECIQSVSELNMDEMAQVSGGDAAGAVWAGCVGVGIGAGAGGGTETDKKDATRKKGAGQACIGIGLGWGKTSCWGSGDLTVF